jgi:hypothetical protein
VTYDHQDGGGVAMSFGIDGADREAVFALARRDSCSASSIVRRAVREFLSDPANAGYLAGIAEAKEAAELARVRAFNAPTGTPAELAEKNRLAAEAARLAAEARAHAGNPAGAA